MTLITRRRLATAAAFSMLVPFAGQALHAQAQPKVKVVKPDPNAPPVAVVEPPDPNAPAVAVVPPPVPGAPPAVAVVPPDPNAPAVAVVPPTGPGSPPGIALIPPDPSAPPALIVPEGGARLQIIVPVGVTAAPKMPDCSSTVTENCIKRPKAKRR
jgi:hypothetical protein